MAEYGMHSTAALATCCDHLQRLFNEVVRHRDNRILEGHRSNGRQDLMFAQGMSKLRAGESEHNQVPSNAVDAAPWFKSKPNIRWNDHKSFYRFVGFVEGVAAKMGLDIRVGADWDSDGEWWDQSFHDLPHFECVTCKRKAQADARASRTV
jgi:peptidoglycan L-alanyl-D-glutamate endopeptidase CwlK